MRKQRKTIFLDQGETLGGAERFLLDMIQSVDAQERNMIRPVIVGAKHADYKQKLPEKVRTIDFDCPSVKGSKIIGMIRIFFASFRLRKILKQESKGFNIQVFANTPRMMLVAWFLKFFWRLDFRLMTMVHDFTIPRFIFSLIAAQSNVILVNSVLTRQVVRSSLDKKEHEKIMIVENGVDFSLLENQKLEFSGEIKKIVLLGRIDPRKGQLFALEAAKELQKRGVEVEISIVGSPFENDLQTEKYEKILHQRAKEWHLENVKFVAEVPSPWDVFAVADLVLVLPIEPETFGRVVIESLALNTPVLVFDEMGPREIMRHFARFVKQDMEYFVCPKHAKDLADRIETLVEKTEMLTPFWKEGRNFVKKYYDQQDTRKQLVNILLDS